MTILFLSCGFDFLKGSNIANLQGIVAVDSFGPRTIRDIEIESYKIQEKRYEGHLGMTKKSYHYSNTRNNNSRKEGDVCTDIRFQRFKDTIAESTPNHYDKKLSNTEIEEDFILILYLYGDFILHGNRVYKVYKVESL